LRGDRSGVTAIAITHLHTTRDATGTAMTRKDSTQRPDDWFESVLSGCTGDKVQGEPDENMNSLGHPACSMAATLVAVPMLLGEDDDDL
jgi:hypothetical protein